MINSNKVLNYDKQLQSNINNQIKIQLGKEGIKNKKRIGLGDIAVCDIP